MSASSKTFSGGGRNDRGASEVVLDTAPTDSALRVTQDIVVNRKPLYEIQDQQEFLRLLGQQSVGYAKISGSMRVLQTQDPAADYYATQQAHYKEFAFFLLERRHEWPRLSQSIVWDSGVNTLEAQGLTKTPHLYSVPVGNVHNYNKTSQDRLQEYLDLLLQNINPDEEGKNDGAVASLRSNITNCLRHNPVFVPSFSGDKPLYQKAKDTIVRTPAGAGTQRVFADMFMAKVNKRVNAVIDTILEHRDLWIGTSKETQKDLYTQQIFSDVLTSVVQELLLPAYNALDIGLDPQRNVTDWDRIKACYQIAVARQSGADYPAVPSAKPVPKGVKPSQHTGKSKLFADYGEAATLYTQMFPLVTTRDKAPALKKPEQHAEAVLSSKRSGKGV